MLALTHHLVVQYAAYLAFQRTFIFSDYIVLGDDIVIADKSVANVYHYLMTNNLQVSINIAKGLMSPIGLEFAKRFYVNSMDLSPVSLKEFQAIGSTYSSFTSAIAKFNVSPSNLLRLMGRGNISIGNTGSKLYLVAKSLSWTLSTFSEKDPMPYLRLFFP